MKKIFLVLILLVSGLVFADDKIIKLQCKLTNKDIPGYPKIEPFITINETAKTLRYNLLPEASYKKYNSKIYGMDGYIAENYDVYSWKKSRPNTKTDLIIYKKSLGMVISTDDDMERKNRTSAVFYCSML